MIVVDASVVIELLLGTAVGVSVKHRLFDSDETVCAPHLLDVEVLQVIRRFVHGREVSDQRGREALQDLVDMSITRYPHHLLLERMWDLRGNVSAYDAAYISLAEALDAPLLTRDRKIRGAKGHRAEIELI